MSKKHFIELADYIRTNREWFTPTGIEILADFCKAQNARFDRARWLGYIDGKNGPSGGTVKAKRELATA